MNIKKSQLKDVIKQVVRESINERTTVDEVNKKDYIGPSLKPIGQTKDKNAGEIKGKGLYAALKSKFKSKKVNEAGLTSEAGGDDVSGTLSRITANIGDDNAIQALNPEVAKKKLTVIRSILNGLVTKSQSKSVAEPVAEPVTEASYKVVSPNQYRCSKCNHALEVQSDPKLTETAYKTQGPSLKTFDDSPQLPDAQNNPKNA